MLDSALKTCHGVQACLTVGVGGVCASFLELEDATVPAWVVLLSHPSVLYSRSYLLAMDEAV